MHSFFNSVTHVFLLRYLHRGFGIEGIRPYGKGIEINFEGMKSKFYDLMKIDPVKAIPVKEVLEEYGMGDEAEVIW